MDKERSILAQRIRKAREDKGYSMERLAAIVGAHRQSVHYWETDQRTPRALQLIPLAQALDVSADWLLGLV